MITSILRGKAIAVAFGMCMVVAASGCGNHDTPTPVTPVDTVSTSQGATDTAKEQAVMQQQLARQKQQEALQHNASPAIPPQ